MDLGGVVRGTARGKYDQNTIYYVYNSQRIKSQIKKQLKRWQKRMHMGKKTVWLSLSLFYCCDKTPGPREVRRVYLRLTASKGVGERSLIILVEIVAIGRHLGHSSSGWELTSWSSVVRQKEKTKRTWAFETSKPAPSDTPPPTRRYLLILPIHLCQVGTEHSDTWAHEGHSGSNHRNA